MGKGKNSLQCRGELRHCAIALVFWQLWSSCHKPNFVYKNQNSVSICSQFLGVSGITKSYKLTCLIHILDNESGVSKHLSESDPGRKIQLVSKFTPHHPINHIISTGVSTGNTEFWFGFNAVSRRHFQYCSRLNFYFCC